MTGEGVPLRKDPHLGVLTRHELDEDSAKAQHTEPEPVPHDPPQNPRGGTGLLWLLWTQPTLPQSLKITPKALPCLQVAPESPWHNYITSRSCAAGGRVTH